MGGESQQRVAARPRIVKGHPVAGGGVIGIGQVGVAPVLLDPRRHLEALRAGVPVITVGLGRVQRIVNYRGFNIYVEDIGGKEKVVAEFIPCFKFHYLCFFRLQIRVQRQVVYSRGSEGLAVDSFHVQPVENLGPGQPGRESQVEFLVLVAARARRKHAERILGDPFKEKSGIVVMDAFCSVPEIQIVSVPDPGSGVRKYPAFFRDLRPAGKSQAVGGGIGGDDRAFGVVAAFVPGVKVRVKAVERFLVAVIKGGGKGEICSRAELPAELGEIGVEIPVQGARQNGLGVIILLRSAVLVGYQPEVRRRTFKADVEVP